MKKFIAAIALTSLFATSAIAAEGALPSGKPAGMKEAQGLLNNTPLLVLGGIAVIVGVVLATQDNSTVATTPATGT
jgi:hypothetical protein